MHWSFSLNFSLGILIYSPSSLTIVSTYVITESNTFDLNLMSQMNHFVLDLLFIALWSSVSLCVLFYIYTYMVGKKNQKSSTFCYLSRFKRSNSALLLALISTSLFPGLSDIEYSLSLYANCLFLLPFQKCLFIQPVLEPFPTRISP